MRVFAAAALVSGCVPSFGEIEQSDFYRCTTDADCLPGFVCTAGTCSAPGGDAMAPAGDIAGGDTLTGDSNTGDSAGGDLDPGPLAITSLSPAIIDGASTTTITVTASATLTGCAVTVGGVPASCGLPVFDECTCTFDSSTGGGEGVVTILATAMGPGGPYSTDGTVVIDRTPPQVTISQVDMIRALVGDPDRVTGNMAVSDSGPSYPGQAVVDVRITSDLGGASLLVSGSPGATGDFDFAIPSSHGTSPAMLAPGAVYISAVDAAGNATPVTQVTNGLDASDPTVDPARITFAVQQPGFTFGLLDGTGGAVDDSVSVVREVRVYDVGGMTPVHTFLPASDGSFVAERWNNPGAMVEVEVEDKTGRTAARTTITAAVHVHNLEGRAQFDDGSAAAALYAFASDNQPQLSAPGMAPLMGGEVPAAVSTAVSATDGSRATLTAMPETGTFSDLMSDNVVGMGPKPSSRFWTVFVYDSARQVVVLYGGAYYQMNNLTAREETWEFDGTAWTLIDTSAGINPGPLWGAAATYDPENGVVIMVGGDVASMSSSADTFEYDGTVWQSVTSVGPPAQSGAAMTYDATRGRAVWLGRSAPGTAMEGSTETWEYVDRTWAQVMGLTQEPTDRWTHTLVYDPRRDAPVLHGGHGYSGAMEVVLGDTQLYDGSTWTDAGMSGIGRRQHSAAFAPNLDAIVLMGGDDLVGPAVYNDIVQINTGGLASRCSGCGPSRFTPGLAYHYGIDQLITFGGKPGYTNTQLDDTDFYDSAIPHGRAATHTFRFNIVQPPGGSMLDVEYVGAGINGSGNNVDLFAWSWMVGAWQGQGSVTASDGAPAAARRIQFTLDPAVYLAGDRLWLMATVPPSAPTSTTQIFTDFIEVRAR